MLFLYSRLIHDKRNNFEETKRTSCSPSSSDSSGLYASAQTDCLLAYRFFGGSENTRQIVYLFQIRELIILFCGDIKKICSRLKMY